MQTGEETQVLQLTKDIVGENIYEGQDGYGGYNTFDNINILGNHIYFYAYTYEIKTIDGKTDQDSLRTLLSMTTDGENITKIYQGEYWQK